MPSLQSFLFVPAVSSGAFFGVLPKEEGERGRQEHIMHIFTRYERRRRRRPLPAVLFQCRHRRRRRKRALWNMQSDKRKRQNTQFSQITDYVSLEGKAKENVF